MHGVPDDCKKLGILFGFGHFEEPVQTSIAVGDPSTAHTRGDDCTTLLFHALFKKMIEIKMEYENSSDSD